MMQIDKTDVTKKAAIVAATLGVSISAPYLVMPLLPYISPIIQDVAKAGLEVLPGISANGLWGLKDSFKSDGENKHLTRLLANAYSQAIEDFLEETKDDSDYEQFGRFISNALPKIKEHIDTHLQTKKEKDLAKLFPNEQTQDKIILDDEKQLPIYKRWFQKKNPQYNQVGDELLVDMSSEEFILAISDDPDKALELMTDEVEINLRRWFWQVDSKLANDFYFVDDATELIFKKIAEMIPAKISRLINDPDLTESWQSFQRSHLQAILHQVKNMQNGLSDDDRDLLRPLGDVLSKLSETDGLVENIAVGTSKILETVGQSEENVKKCIKDERKKLQKCLEPKIDEILRIVREILENRENSRTDVPKTIAYKSVLPPNIGHRIYGRTFELKELLGFLQNENRHGAIIGQTCWGKTSLIRKFLYRHFDQVENKSEIPEVFTDVLYIDCKQNQDFEKLLSQFNVFMKPALVGNDDDKAEFWRSEVFSRFAERKVLLVIDNFEEWLEDEKYKNEDIEDFVKTFLAHSGNARGIFLSWFNPHKEADFSMQVTNLTTIEGSLSNGLKSKDAIALVKKEGKQYCTDDSVVDLNKVLDVDLEEFFVKINHNPQSIQSMVHFIGDKQCRFAEFQTIFQKAFKKLEEDDKDLDAKRGDLSRSAKAMLTLQLSLLDEATKRLLLHIAFYGIDVPHDILLLTSEDNLDNLNRLVKDHIVIRSINKGDSEPLRLYNVHNSIRRVIEEDLKKFKDGYEKPLTALANQMHSMCKDAFNNKLNNKQLALAESWEQLENYLIEDRQQENREFERDSANFYKALAFQRIVETDSAFFTKDQKAEFVRKIEKIYLDFINKYKDEESRKDPIAVTYNNLGNLLFKDERRRKEAEEAYKKAIELNPNDASAYYNLGTLLGKDERRRKEAEEAYKKAIELNPNDASAYYNLGNWLVKDERRRKEAEEAYKKAIEINPNLAEAYNNLGLLLVKDERRRKEAEEAYKKAIEINPNLASAYYNLGNLLVKDERRRKEAEEAYKKAIELNPNDASAYNNLGILLFKDERRRKEAEEAYKKAIELNPNDASAYNNLGILLSKDERRRKEAEEAYKKAIELNPNDASAYYNLGNLLFKDERRRKEAEEAYKKAIELNPNDADAYFNFARLRSLSELEENKDEAVEFLLKAVELDSEFKGKAKNDSDFDFIRDDERFKEIVGD